MTRATLLLAGMMISAATAAQAQDVPRMVSGRIFDDSTGCPLRSVQVMAVGSAVHVATDANGRYRMSNPPTGTFTLQAVLRGYQPNNAGGMAVSDSTARVDFSLFRAPGDSTAGTVYPKRACRLEPRDSL
jgi:Ser-tRNA(Ala) deacylase AlaX